MLSMMKDMAKTNLCTPDLRYQETLSFMQVKARRDMKQRMEEDSEAIWEDVSIVGESSKKNDEAQGKMKQQFSTSLAGKRCEDKQENDAGEFLGTPKCKIRHEATREKKKLRRDEGQKLSEEEKKKRNTQKASEEEKSKQGDVRVQ